MPASKQNVFAVGPIPVLAHASAFSTQPTIMAMIEQNNFSFFVNGIFFLQCHSCSNSYFQYDLFLMGYILFIYK